MVAPKKQLGVAPPVASRTNSSTNTPKAKGKSAQKSQAASPLTNGASKVTVPVVTVGGDEEPKGPLLNEDTKFYTKEDTKPSPQKAAQNDGFAKKDQFKTKAKGKKSSSAKPRGRRPRRKPGVLEYLVRIFLILAGIYSLLVCPQDPNLANPVCRGLEVYRRAILEPYILPPINSVLYHPTVAPFVNQVVVLSEPYRLQASQQWQKHVVPRAQLLEARTLPYLQRVEREYSVRLAPHVRIASYNLARYRKQAEPYITQARVHVEPYVNLLWQKAKELPSWLVVNVIARVGDAREKYVDPQVKKIVEKVEELGDKGQFIKSKAFESTESGQAHSSTKPTSTISLPPVPEPTPSNAESDTFVPPPTTSAVVIPVASAREVTAAAPPADAVPTATAEDEEVDLDDFLADILGGPDTTTEQATPTPEPTPETPEEIAERKRLKDIETAEKRADITGRHTQWEIDLKEVGEGEVDSVIDFLVGHREHLAVDLRDSPEFKKQVTGLSEEANKALKNTEAYFRKLGAEKRGGAEKVALWDTVIEKVDAKFLEKVRAIEQFVGEWWEQQVAIELEEVERAGKVALDLASDAQADIGMDYAWLDDVTHMDWTRYHELMRTAKRFREEYISIQNGTHPRAPPNPVLPVLEGYQLELQEIVAGFDTRLSQIKRKGYRIFSGGVVGKEEAAEEPEVSILPVPPVQGAGGAAEQVILGRGQEEVAEAVSRAEEAKIANAKESWKSTGETFEEDPFGREKADTEGVVNDIFEGKPEAAAPHHEEL